MSKRTTVWVLEGDNRYYDEGNVWTVGVFKDPADAMIAVFEEANAPRTDWGWDSVNECFANTGSDDTWWTVTPWELQ